MKVGLSPLTDVTLLLSYVKISFYNQEKMLVKSQHDLVLTAYEYHTALSGAVEATG